MIGPSASAAAHLPLPGKASRGAGGTDLGRGDDPGAKGDALPDVQRFGP